MDTIHRNLLKTGDVILVRYSMPYLIGWGIQAVTGDYFAHSAVYIGDGKLVEAKGQGVRVSELDKLLAHGHIKVGALLLREELENKREILKNIALSIVGRPYDFKAFTYMTLLFGLVRLGLVNRKKIREVPDPVDEENKFFCHQVVGYVYYKAKLPLMNIHWTNALASDFLDLRDIYFRNEILPLKGEIPWL